MSRAAHSAFVWLRGPQPDPEPTAAADDKHGPTRRLLYWTAAAVLLLGFAVAAMAETHLDEVYDRGPLSASAVKIRQIAAFGSAAQVILRRCRSELVSGSPLKPPVAGLPWSYVVYGADPAQHLYACYERTPGDSFVIGNVLTSAGQSATNTAALERAGAWPTVDPFGDGELAFALAACVVMIGLGYYLRRSAGTTQKPSRLRFAVSVLPGLGLFALFGGNLRRRTRSRIFLYQVAAIAVMIEFTTPGLRAPTSPPDLALALLRFATVAVFFLGLWQLPKARALPAISPAGIETAAVPPSPAVAQAAAASRYEIVDVTDIAAAASGFYWMVAGLKFSAIVFGGLMFAAGPGWRTLPEALAGAALILAIAMLLQEDRLTPPVALAAGLVALTALAGACVATGLISHSNAVQPVVGWAVSAGFFATLYWHRLGKVHLPNGSVQGMTRIGHLPGGRDPHLRRRVPLTVWARAAIGVVLSVPLIALSTIASYFGVAGVTDQIQEFLGALYSPARRQVALLGRYFRPRHLTILLGTSGAPDAWSIKVRGDAFRWGQLGSHSVDFEEFLTARLEQYGEVCAPSTEESGQQDSIAVMLAQPPIPLDLADTMAALAGQMPLLLLWQPSRTGYSPRDWGALRGYLASRNVSLPVIGVPAGLLAILRPATGECRVYVAKKPDQWAYLSVLAEVFR